MTAHSENSFNSFVRLASIDVGKHIEKKGGLSYLSWAWAVDQLLRNDPTANWTFQQPTLFPDGTMMVSCVVTAFGVARQMQLPVMDYKNRAIANPDAFAVNTAMQRCLVKAIALHGLGLYIYAGEDVPDGAEEKRPNTATQVAKDAFDSMGDEEQRFLEERAVAIISYVESGDPALACKYMEEQRFDNDQKLAVWSLLPSNIRSAIKKHKEHTK